MLLTVLSSLILSLVGPSRADCGDVSLSPDHKTQSIEPCPATATSDANVTLMPGVVRLDLSGTASLDSLNCSDSTDLTTIVAPNLTSIGQLYLQNVLNLTSVDMPALVTVSNVTLHEIGNSTMPGFLHVERSIGLTDSEVENFTAWSQQMNELEVVGNSQLEGLSFPMLRKLGGGLRIDNNSNLNDLANAFPSLEEVGGAVQIYGNISSISFPKLSNIKQGLEVVGSSDLDCDTLLNSLGKLRVSSQTARCRKDYAVTAPAITSTVAPTAPATATTSSPANRPATSETGLSSRAKIGIGVGLGIGVPLVAGFVVLVMWVIRRRSSRGDRSGPRNLEKNSSSEMPRQRTEEYSDNPLGSEAAMEKFDVNPPPIPVLSGAQVRRSGSKFKEHGLRPDGREEDPP
ncbi:hypothetical protein GQ53DRAFT_826196 [Thozetella sp. PMI_491]|nr:hypothetical protein GQ53DRAFT_826196 [Thozetella sp. PMI_491]